MATHNAMTPVKMAKVKKYEKNEFIKIYTIGKKSRF